MPAKTISNPIPVRLHRQDKKNLCGAACIQMIRQFEGIQISALVQKNIMDEVKKAAGIPAECLEMDCWDMCPHALTAGLNAGQPGLYKEFNAQLSVEASIRVIAQGVTKYGKPSVVLVNNGTHWIVVHGVRGDEGTGLHFDVRDPWPPEAKEDDQEEELDDGADEGVAASHLIFPAGIRWRFTPADLRQTQGGNSRWMHQYVAVVPESATAGPGPFSPPPESSGSDGVTEEAARNSAEFAFARAQALGWPPSVGINVAAGYSFRLNMPKPSNVNAIRAQRNYLVELVQKNGTSNSVIAIAFVAAGGPYAGETLEMMAPAGGRSWLKKEEKRLQFFERQRVRLRERIMSNSSKSINASSPRLIDAVDPWPGNAEELPDSLRWLLDDKVEGVKLEYFWASSRETRSPFYPVVRISKDHKEALLMPNGRFRANSEFGNFDIQR